MACMYIHVYIHAACILMKSDLLMCLSTFMRLESKCSAMRENRLIWGYKWRVRVVFATHRHANRDDQPRSNWAQRRQTDEMHANKRGATRMIRVHTYKVFVHACMYGWMDAYMHETVHI